MKPLLIVESPKKAKEIQKFLGDGFVVQASYGHIRDLPSKGAEPGELVVGVNADFGLRYEISDRAKPTVAKLREAANAASRVLLATDPDREGEAIAWHLVDALKLKSAQRVTYTEVTPAAVRAAIAKPRPLDMNLVCAQEARRALDRLVGYAVSPALSAQAGQTLSAGRVQTPALRIVVEREREIRNFKRRQHFGVQLGFSGGWSAQWLTKPHLQPGEEFWTDAPIASLVAVVRRVRVVDFANGETRERPAAPFTTSTLQQEASKRLGLKMDKALAAAQALFDSGHITYHRTDSPNFSAEGREAIREFARAAGLPVAGEDRIWKAKTGAQQGHEAIRPTRMDVADAGDDEAQRALYALIRARSLASVMPDAVYSTRTAILEAQDFDVSRLGGIAPRFEAKGRVLTDKGWRAAYSGDTPDEGEDRSEDEGELSNPIPVLEPDAVFYAESGRRLDKSTEPPRRYTEAGLLRQLEALGIGRPSTWTAIITNIVSRAYVVADDKKGKFLVPTATGEALIDALAQKFSFADLDFTAAVEAELDHVASGNRPYSAVVAQSWRTLQSELPGLQINATPEHPCPACGKALRRRKGANGFFWGCVAYPECKTSLPDARGKPGQRPQASDTHKCTQPGCGKPLVRRTKKGKDGYDFYGCTGFPDCRASYSVGNNGEPVPRK